MKPHHRADAALLLVTLSWGLTFPLIRSAVQELSPEHFLASRFSLAALAFVPLVVASRGARRGLWRAVAPGLGLGVLAWSSYYTQTLGLQTVPAGRAAFITGTSVILVPLMAPLFRSGRPSAMDLAAALLATVGMYLLTDPAGGGFSAGDGWILLCATTYAVYIHLLQKVLRRDHHDVSLAFTQVVGIALCGMALLPAARGQAPVWSTGVLVAIVVCAVFATVGTFWLQTRFQGRTTPQRVALIFSMEPVFAAFFAYMLLGETMTAIGAAGAVVILIAVVGAEILAAPPGRKPPPA